MKKKKNVENRIGQSIETLVDLIMNRTAEALVDEVNNGVEKRFQRWYVKTQSYRLSRVLFRA